MLDKDPNALQTEETTSETEKENAEQQQLEHSKQEVEDVKKEIQKEVPTRLSLSQAIGKGKETDFFSATRLQGGGALFKGGKLQTDLYAQLDLTNMKDPSGFLRANKQVYK
jgi:hypothetical protein